MPQPSPAMRDAPRRPNERLVWIDLEMTGLTPSDGIPEIATVVTDARLNVLAEGPDLAIAHPLATLEAMDDWNRNQHGKSGFVAPRAGGGRPAGGAGARTLAFPARVGTSQASPMCGNSICGTGARTG